MVRTFRASETEPLARGREFGSAHADRIADVVARYRAMFDELHAAPFDIARAGAQALAAIERFSPPLHREIIGMAEGAGCPAEHLGAINARTEILALLNARSRGECSAVIMLPAEGGPPVAVQTWDWHYRFRDCWLIREIPLQDGTVTRTLTEYGIVGKAGLNSRGLGLLFTILHHRNDGAGIGVPVHVAARAVLDDAADINHAVQMLAAAGVSASSSINLVAWEAGCSAAITVELHPGGPGLVLPGADGLLIHTNHFLCPAAAPDDLEAKAFPDTLIRENLLRRRLTGAAARRSQVLEAMNSHLGGNAAVCCHHRPGEDADSQYETLATICLDLENGTLAAHAGGPCTINSAHVAG